jgi:hypothetical protein
MDNPLSNHGMLMLPIFQLTTIQAKDILEPPSKDLGLELFLIIVLLKTMMLLEYTLEQELFV